MLENIQNFKSRVNRFVFDLEVTILQISSSSSISIYTFCHLK